MKLSTALLIALGLGLVQSTASANLLSNPGFEDPVTSDGPPFVGSWEAFTSGPFAVSRNSILMPRTGLQSLELGIDNQINSFAGVFQDVLGLTAGEVVNYSGWHLSSLESGGIEIRIEWRDSVADVEIARTPNFVPLPGSSYEIFNLNAAVPLGADTARVVYAIQSFTGAINQLVYLDDFSLTTEAVETPEPATLGLLALGGMMILFTRRRRRPA